MAEETGRPGQERRKRRQKGRIKTQGDRFKGRRKNKRRARKATGGVMPVAKPN